MCSKVGYRSKSEAKKHARQVIFDRRLNSNRSRAQKDPKKLKPYLCPHCDRWHLTTLAPNVNRQHKARRPRKAPPSLTCVWIETRVRAQLPEIAAAIAQSLEVKS